MPSKAPEHPIFFLPGHVPQVPTYRRKFGIELSAQLGVAQVVCHGLHERRYTGEPIYERVSQGGHRWLSGEVVALERAVAMSDPERLVRDRNPARSIGVQRFRSKPSLPGGLRMLGIQAGAAGIFGASSGHQGFTIADEQRQEGLSRHLPSKRSQLADALAHGQQQALGRWQLGSGLPTIR